MKPGVTTLPRASMTVAPAGGAPSAVTETTALGAAWLAGLATGVYSGLSDLTALWRSDRVFEPTWDRARAQERMARWEHAVRQATAD